MRTGFEMDRDHIGPGRHELGDIALGLHDHQVDVEGQACALADRRHDGRADRDIRYESPVHDIDVKLIGAGGLDTRDVGAERGEVGREDRGRDLDHVAVIPRSYARWKRMAAKPSVPWRSGRHRSQPSASSGSGNLSGGSIVNSGRASRNALTTASFSSGSSEQVA